MSITYQDRSGASRRVQSVEFNGVPINRLEYESADGSHNTVWCRPYTLSVQKDEGVVSVEVKRTASQEPSATIGALTDGAEIYYGDTLTVSAAANESSYKLNDYTPSYTVTGNVNVNITTTTKITTLAAPDISGTFALDAMSGQYRGTVYIYNPNTVEVEAYYTVQNAYNISSGSGLLSIPAKTTRTGSTSKLPSAQATVTVTFSCDGYISKSASKTIGSIGLDPGPF